MSPKKPKASRAADTGSRTATTEAAALDASRLAAAEPPRRLAERRLAPEARRLQSSARVNEFAFKIATVNGTGSASANGLLLQAIFRMGIPVSGKNVFPSNIQGLPTWYEFRVNRDGYTARTPDFDLLVAMNPATYARDIAEVRTGGWLMHDSSWPLPKSLGRKDITFLGMPFGDLCVRHFEADRERVLMKNIVYTGALAALLDFDLEVIRTLIRERFGKKQKLMDSNHLAIDLGYEAATSSFQCPLPVRLETMDATRDSILLDGNTAAALGCVYAGATVGAWYPITPATSLMDAFSAFCEKYRVDPETQRRKFFIAQAEDELAAAGVVIGAGWMGARAFTPTAGPGISLMSEFIGLAYYAEVPAVFFDIQRTGPSTGMPTRTQQGDLLLIAYASHGDTKHIALFPADPEECFYFAVRAFDLAERFQTPVFVVSDLDIGMNDWLVRRLQWDDAYRPDRGKVLDAAALEELQQFHRYLDVDGDGIPYRTLPGSHPKGAYFTRGSGHDKHGRYTEDAEAYAEVMSRIAQKIDSARHAVPAAEVRTRDGAKDGVITIGGCHRAVVEALDVLERESGARLDYLRVRGFPFGDEVAAFIAAHERCFVVEQNRDAQLRSLLLLETGASAEKLVPCVRFGGLPMSARFVLEDLLPHLPAAAAAVEADRDRVRDDHDAHMLLAEALDERFDE